MVTRTFRMDPEFDKLLNEEAEKQGLSVSALLNRIIQRYILFTRFTEVVPAITLPYAIFDELIERINDEDLIKIGEKMGAIIPEETILQRGKLRNFDTTIWLLEVIYSKYNNWFNYSHNIVDRKERLHLSHQLHHKWSTYLGSYVGAMFKSILDINPKIETRANSVTVYLSKHPSFTQIMSTKQT